VPTKVGVGSVPSVHTTTTRPVVQMELVPVNSFERELGLVSNPYDTKKFCGLKLTRLGVR